MRCLDGAGLAKSVKVTASQLVLMQVPVHVNQLGVDMLTIVGHKFGAPKGVAALYIREGVQLGNYFHGGGQVRSLGNQQRSLCLIFCDVYYTGQPLQPLPMLQHRQGCIG